MSIFKDKSTMPEKAPDTSLSGIAPMEAPPQPLTVHTAQTFEQLNNCNRVYCRDNNDVRNITRPRFGHGY